MLLEYFTHVMTQVCSSSSSKTSALTKPRKTTPRKEILIL